MRASDDIFFVIRAPRRCVECGSRFHAPCGHVLCGLTLLGGVLMVVAAMIQDIVPSGYACAIGDWSAHHVVDFILGIAVALGGMVIAAVAVRTWRYGAWYRRMIQHPGRDLTEPPSVTL